MRSSRSFLSLSLSVLAAMASLALAPLAQAVPVTVSFSGNVYFGASPLGSLTGQTVSGSFTYESASPDLDPATASMGHYQPITSALVTVGGFAATYVAGTSDLWIYDNLVVGPGVFTDGVSVDFVTTSNNVSGYTLSNFGLLLYTPNNATTAFSTDALPTSGAGWPAISAFSGYNTLTLSFANGGPGTYATATITSLTATASPGTPDGGSVALLLGAGLLATWTASRRLRPAARA